MDGEGVCPPACGSGVRGGNCLERGCSSEARIGGSIGVGRLNSIPGEGGGFSVPPSRKGRKESREWTGEKFPLSWRALCRDKGCRKRTYMHGVLILIEWNHKW